ncbi:MAG: hypothetical protein OJF49_000250 [Ktedonobacterales bacterium]|jgi:monoamine oxidase|nr:MAG: hypothetical protein OJF49_000250 [Ktedonobacterales bacterium]
MDQPAREDRHHDVLVIGGGFAGVAAARALSEQGRSVALLEARDRLGGRTWYRPFAGTQHSVEIGGQWIAPRWQPHIAAEIARYRLPISHIVDPTAYVSLVGGQRLTSALPVPPDEVFDLERVMHAAITAAKRLDADAPLVNPPADLDTPFTDFIAPLSLPPATHDYITAFVANMFGCAAAEVSTLSVLSWVAAYNYSAIAVYLGESEMFAQGTSSAIAAMLRDSTAALYTSTPVRAVTQDAQGVTATTHDGETFTASAAVIAVPLNCLANIEFSPPLSDAKRTAAAERHAGHMAKVWALVHGVPETFYGAGHGPGMIWLATHAVLPEGNLMVGFGHDPDALDTTSLPAVQRAISAFAPTAEVLAIDAHDWCTDPYALGTWVAYRPGQLTRFGSALRAPEGRLAFATSDIATRWAGWMEGALISGKVAADHASSFLSA